MLDKIIDDKEVVFLIKHMINSFSIDISNYEIKENDIFDSLQYGKERPLRTKEKFLNKSLGIGSQISQLSGLYYPHEIDNYCKIVKGIKFYGRYMDDTYIISNSKEQLHSLLNEIKEICDELGIFINKKKTHIFRIDKVFTFLKIKYRLTNTGHLVRVPCKSNFTRERRKLKSFKKMLDKNEMNYSDIEMQYKAWRGCLLQYDCHNVIRNMDKIYDELFKKYK